MPSVTSRVRRVLVSVSVGRTAEAAGTSSTSSNVSAWRISMLPPDQGWRRTIHGPPRKGSAARRNRYACAAEPLRDDIDLGRFGAARRRLGVAHGGEIALQRREQRALGAALIDLGDEGAARREHAARELVTPPRPARRCAVIGGAVAGRGRRHVGEHDVGLARPAPRRSRRALRGARKSSSSTVAPGDRRPSAADRSPTTRPRVGRLDARDRDLGPAAGRRAEIDARARRASAGESGRRARSA